MSKPILKQSCYPFALFMTVLVVSKAASPACGGEDGPNKAAFFVGQAVFVETRPEIREVLSDLFRVMVDDPSARLKISNEHPLETTNNPVGHVDGLIGQAIDTEANPKIRAILQRLRRVTIPGSRTPAKDVTSQNIQGEYPQEGLTDHSELAHQLNQFDGHVADETQQLDLESELTALRNEMNSLNKRRKSNNTMKRSIKPTPYDPSIRTKRKRKGKEGETI